MLTVVPHISRFHFRAGKRGLSSDYLQRKGKWLPTKKPLEQFRRLQRRGPSSIDSYALLRVLRAQTKASSRVARTQLHTFVITLGFEPVVHLQTALIGMYSEMGSIKDAHRVFDETSCRTVVCWTALISAYVNNSRPGKALELFRQMQLENVEPDRITITIALSACADLGALDAGEWIHMYIYRHPSMGLGEDLILRNALINMYAKCGRIQAARHLFDSAKQRDVTTWTSMIVGLALHGRANEALMLFAEMKESISSESNGCRVSPNHVTFVGVLMACSHAGLVSEGRFHWENMQRDYNLRPRLAHYGCMVDLFCRAGLLEDAYAFIKGMPVQRNAVIWRTLLAASCLHGNVSLGALARRRLLELEPDYAGDDVTLSNVYAAAGLWDEKQDVRKRMKRQRDPGCSLIEVGSRTHEFVAADRRHP
ncbi:putative pentatricopeptide repeat-containing protein At1g74400 [Phoenix dactylifera]|uniref:Pentatricopeptide repeat-containing protein At1g74400 n=1 Tax=Phoenix dactylifera TaxID=42345 RepID=A0A8B7CJI5_PHODC|nr:putative pentatricopeptide repeat-containing protein At1g74400 [Phoenix dactylifera]